MWITGCRDAPSDQLCRACGILFVGTSSAPNYETKGRSGRRTLGTNHAVQHGLDIARRHNRSTGQWLDERTWLRAHPPSLELRMLRSSDSQSSVDPLARLGETDSPSPA